MATENGDLLQEAISMLKNNEGYRQFCYLDGNHIPTIGYGRNLASKGIDRVEAEWLLTRDILDAMNRLASLRCWTMLTEGRQLALIDLCVNLGHEGLLGFTKFLAYLDLGAYTRAAEELVLSRAAQEEPNRIFRDAAIIRDGVAK